MKKYATPMILLAAVCWGWIGYFSIHLANGGYTSVEITFLRCAVTAICLWVGLFTFQRKSLKIKLKDGWLFLGTGLLSIVFFNTMYFLCIQYSSLSMAAVLLYTAPAIVTVLSAIFFKERITPIKIIALAVALLGCAFTSGVLKNVIAGVGLQHLCISGILTGLASGLGYALYTIFGNVALKKYNTFTVTAYTFLVATLCLAPFCLKARLFYLAAQPSVSIHILSIGIISTLLPFLLYTMGLKYTEPSKASILAFVEPMVATIVGVFIFHEPLTVYSVCGIVCIFLSICLLQVPAKKSVNQE